MQKITPFLWFDGKTEEAITFYTSLFKDSKIVEITRFDVPGQGSVVTATFELAGQQFMALDGGPMFKFTEAVSLYVDCKDQEEVDYFWNGFIANGGVAQACGWLKDKYGLSWQIIPAVLEKLLRDKDKAKAQRVMSAMLKMEKIIIADLEEAYEG